MNTSVYSYVLLSTLLVRRPSLQLWTAFGALECGRGGTQGKGKRSSPTASFCDASAANAGGQNQSDNARASSDRAALPDQNFGRAFEPSGSRRTKI